MHQFQVQKHLFHEDPLTANDAFVSTLPCLGEDDNDIIGPFEREISPADIGYKSPDDFVGSYMYIYLLWVVFVCKFLSLK